MALHSLAGERAFRLAAEALGSAVQRSHAGVYGPRRRTRPLRPRVAGTLLHHLRDPARALAALRRVLDGELIVNEPVIAGPDSLRRRPLAELIVSDVAARQPCGAR